MRVAGSGPEFKASKQVPPCTRRTPRSRTLSRYGVFKFRVVYNRRGLTVLRSETLVSLRPLNHDEEERFIEAAFPYYASVASMMAGFVVFGCVFLYSRDE